MSTPDDPDLANACPCRTCHAEPGQQCRTSTGSVRSEAHGLRWLSGLPGPLARCPAGPCDDCRWTGWAPADDKLHAAEDRCPSCDHLRSFHSEPGCWLAVAQGTTGKPLGCPCTVVDWPRRPAPADVEVLTEWRTTGVPAVREKRRVHRWAGPWTATGDPAPRAEGCPLHSWQFDGDDPYVICINCDEMRDAITGRVIRPGRYTDSQGVAE